jgi:pectate lyase
MNFAQEFELRWFLVAMVICHGCASAQPWITTWTGSGNWTSAKHWSHGLPTVLTEASVRNDSDLKVGPGNFTVARLDIGTEGGDNVRTSLNGGHLLVRQDSLVVGERTGGSAEFDLNAGVFESVMDIFVGGASASAGRMNHSLLRVAGGRLTGLSLTIGEGLGSHSTVAIVGSTAESVSALEFVTLHAEADPGGTPGVATLSFTVDEHGVTPISISSRFQGLYIRHDETGTCRLQVNLSSVPPRDDITLIESRAQNRGEFSGLPEGSQITADFGGHTYTWKLTYKGGSSGHDVVLRNTSTYPQDAPVTYSRARRPLTPPSWYGHPVFPLAIAPGTPAFPGAEGYGANTKGGRGGRVIAVENLNDAGPGSLRAALEATGPRKIQFRVGGDIVLRSTITIKNPYLTVDASSAPGPGITVRRHGIEVQTHDVILRQFRIRIGDDDVRRDDQGIRYGSGDGEYALYFSEGSANSIADHLSLSWSTNKILSTTKFADRITIQWCMLAEALNLDQHGYASIAGGNRVTWHHNLFAHNLSRNPRFQGSVDADFRNNVIYDWGEASAYGEFDRLNYIGNYLKPGPSTTQKPLLFMDGIEVVGPSTLYLADNFLEGSSKATTDKWKGTAFYFDRSVIAASNPFPAPVVSTTSAAQAYTDVLNNAGATSPQRDSTDARIVNEVRTGTGQIIQSPEGLDGCCEFGRLEKPPANTPAIAK